MNHIVYLVMGILLIIGGLFAFRHTQGYLKLNTTSKAAQTNQWWGFDLWFGYIASGILSVVGLILVFVSFF